MTFRDFGKMSIVTHGFKGWWWASRHGYPGDEHGVRIPVYGWVDTEAAETAEVAVRAPTQTIVPEHSATGTTSINAADRSVDYDDRIAHFPTRV